MLEIIPINSSGDTIIERHLRIKAINADLTEHHLTIGQVNASSQSQIYCTGKDVVIQHLKF